MRPRSDHSDAASMPVPALALPLLVGKEMGGDSRFKFPLFLPSDILSGRSVRGGGVTTDRQCERPLCCGGGGKGQVFGLKVSERLP